MPVATPQNPNTGFMDANDSSNNAHDRVENANDNSMKAAEIALAIGRVQTQKDLNLQRAYVAFLASHF